jgi:hypothetical protein
VSVRSGVLRFVITSMLAAAVLAGCGGGTKLLQHGDHHRGASPTGAPSSAPAAAGNPAERLNPPSLATKNTTRLGGVDPIADAADVALTVYPSVIPGTHPRVVTLAPSGDWEAAIAASVFMATPIHAPILFSNGTALPPVSQTALNELAPIGSNQLNGAEVIRIGDVAAPAGKKAATIDGSDPYTLAANIDKLATTIDGRPSINVLVASSTAPAYAMPAAGWAAESGEPILFVDGATIPEATRQALLAHQRPHIYVLGPPSVIPDSVLSQLGRYGNVKRISSADTPEANAVAFARYRNPACIYAQPCAHVPNSFGWAIDSPGHGYVLLNADRTLDAAAAAPLSGSGDFGPELLTANATTLPSSVLNYFLTYATPGYSQGGPTAAVYNHGWVIGGLSAITFKVQAEVDELLEVVPQK